MKHKVSTKKKKLLFYGFMFIVAMIIIVNINESAKQKALEEQILRDYKRDSISYAIKAKQDLIIAAKKAKRDSIAAEKEKRAIIERRKQAKKNLVLTNDIVFGIWYSKYEGVKSYYALEIDGPSSAHKNRSYFFFLAYVKVKNSGNETIWDKAGDWRINHDKITFYWTSRNNEFVASGKVNKIGNQYVMTLNVFNGDVVKLTRI